MILNVLVVMQRYIVLIGLYFADDARVIQSRLDGGRATVRVSSYYASAVHCCIDHLRAVKASEMD